MTSAVISNIPLQERTMLSESEEQVARLKAVAEKYLNEANNRPAVDACMHVIHMDHTASSVRSAIVAHKLIGSAIRDEMETAGNMHEYLCELYKGLYYFLNEAHHYEFSDGRWALDSALAAAEAP